MKRETTKKRIDRAALPVALAMPMLLAAPGAAHADGGTEVRIDVGQVADVVQHRVVQVGDVIAHLASETSGTCAVTSPVGVLMRPVANGTDVTLDVTADCTVVVNAITNHVADATDEATGLSTLSPGTGLPPLPDSDAVPDPGLVTDVDPAYLAGVVTCKHQGWAKATVLMKEVWGWMTVAETRDLSNWSSTGYNQCYGRSVTNMIVNTNPKYSYCYTADWEYVNNDTCYYRVKKGAPEETWSDVFGRYLLYKNYFTLHAYDYADTGTQFVPYCFITDGSLPRDSKIDCHGRQDF
jgi:hypothetical protein